MIARLWRRLVCLFRGCNWGHWLPLVGGQAMRQCYRCRALAYRAESTEPEG